MKPMVFNVNMFVAFLMILFTSYSCSYAQKKDDPMPKPKVQYHVNKEVDEHGNIIRYDSTYTWSWSNVDTEANSFVQDSVFAKFFQDWRSPFDNDSLLFGFKPFSFPSFDDDWFNIDKQMERMMQQHRQMMKQHEEMMKRFFQPRPLIPAPQQQQEDKDLNPQQQSKPKKTNTDQRGIDM
jgi:hypothetical protein